MTPTPESQQTALKPCPCCHATEVYEEHDSWCFVGQKYEKYSSPDGFRVRCDNCGLQTCWWHTEDEMLSAWNRRTPVSESHAALIEELGRLTRERDEATAHAALMWDTIRAAEDAQAARFDKIREGIPVDPLGDNYEYERGLMSGISQARACAARGKIPFLDALKAKLSAALRAPVDASQVVLKIALYCPLCGYSRDEGHHSNCWHEWPKEILSTVEVAASADGKQALLGSMVMAAELLDKWDFPKLASDLRVVIREYSLRAHPAGGVSKSENDIPNGWLTIDQVIEELEKDGLGPEIEAARQRFRALRAAGIGAGVVPEGWKLVPPEPTKEMLLALSHVDYAPGENVIHNFKPVEPAERYRRLLAAAPSHAGKSE